MIGTVISQRRKEISEKGNRLETLIITRENGLAVVTLNNPPMNTLSSTMVAELIRTINQLGDDEKVRAILINARGRAFCAGAELGVPESAAGPASFDVRKFVVSVNQQKPSNKQRLRAY